MQKQSQAIDEFDLNQDGVVTVDEIEYAVKKSFSNVKHDIVQLKKAQETALKQFTRVQTDLDGFIHKDDFAGHTEQLFGVMRRIEGNLRQKEEQLLKHMAVLERRISRMGSIVMEGADLKAKVTDMEKSTKKFEGVLDLSHLNKQLHEEMLRLSRDIFNIKYSVKDELHGRLNELESQLSKFTGDAGAEAFITREHLTRLVKDLRKQHSHQRTYVDSRLKVFWKRVGSVEKLLLQRSEIEGDLKDLRTHLSAAEELLLIEKEALAAKKELKELRKRMLFMEIQRESDVREMKLMKAKVRQLTERQLLGDGQYEKIALVGIKRKKGYLYYVDKDGDISCVPMARGRTKGSTKKKPTAKKAKKKATAKKKPAKKRKK